ncbi:MAG: hypothetical protein ACXU86_14745 [Archangium sp.]
MAAQLGLLRDLGGGGLMLFWILLLIVVIIIFGVGVFVRLFLWIAIALLIIWLIAFVISRMRGR